MKKMNISEYDAFGPWIFIIDSEHPLPKVFEKHKTAIDDSKMCFKIPRKIERRVATKDMHLYDLVVAVFDTYLIILKRNENSVTEEKIALSDIAAIENSHFLLMGKVSLFTLDKTIEIEYNTVSVAIIENFLKLIRNLRQYREVSLNLPYLEYSKDTIDFLFTYLTDKERGIDPQIGLIAYQPKYEAVKKKGLINRIISSFNKPTNLTCIAFLANDQELIIINRSSPLDKNKNENYAYTYVYIPLANIDSVKIIESDNAGLSELKIKVAGNEFSSPFNASNKGIRDLKNCF